jgi:hypothetical protein
VTRRLWCTALAAALLALPGVARAQGTVADSAAVLAVVQRLFDALGTRDAVVLRALLAPGARFTAVRVDSAGDVARTQADTAILRSLAMGRERMLERMWAPIVRVHGPIATVWTRYDFHVDGRRTHCGVDAVTLVRGTAGWQVSDITYTVERRGCAPSPLGPPA